MMKCVLMLGLSLSSLTSHGGQRESENPFAPPLAKVQRAPSRRFDLQHLKLVFDVDYPTRSVRAVAVNRLKLLDERSREIVLHASPDLRITQVLAQGRPVPWERIREGVSIALPAGSTRRVWEVKVIYNFHRTEAARREEPKGWHWHSPSSHDPSQVGFWTRGEPDQTRLWAVTWDFPNDFATTETHTTVPAGWDVIGNGLMTSNRLSADGTRRTVVWSMRQPHATYLTSLVGGPMTIRTDSWNGVPLIYAAPRGPDPNSREGRKIGFNVFEFYNPNIGAWLDYTCAHTKDMMTFFKDLLGVAYPYPKYAQTFTYSHNGGLENISATAMGLFVTNPREGHYESDWIVAHELAHQWFGDLVTCQEWGELWLNEAFAMFMQGLWTQKYRGQDAFMREKGSHMRSYVFGSQEYIRPISTTLFRSPNDMFDSHSYEKGAVLLHSLKTKLGDKVFFRGVNRYLTQNRHKPVGTKELCRAMSEAAGQNLNPWFDQWILKPGHPVLDWSWRWDDLAQEAAVTVKQAQDAGKGVPIYATELKLAFLFETGGTRVERRTVTLRDASQDFRLKFSRKPDAVVLDPDQDLLREIRRQPWAGQELWTVFKLAPNCIDREAALNRITVAEASDEDLAKVAEILKADRALFPAFMQTTLLGNLKRPSLRSFFESEARHKNLGRRRQALRALSQLPSARSTNDLLRTLVNANEPYDVVSLSLGILGKLDFKESEPLLRQHADSIDTGSREAALKALLANGAPDALDLAFSSAQETEPYPIRAAGFGALGVFKGDDARLVPMLRRTIRSNDYAMAFEAMSIARARKIKELLPDLRDLLKRTPYAVDILESAIKQIEAP